MLSLKTVKDSFITALIFLLSTLLGLQIVLSPEEESVGHGPSAEQLFEMETSVNRARLDEL